jgi:hypothetical protein
MDVYRVYESVQLKSFFLKSNNTLFISNIVVVANRAKLFSFYIFRKDHNLQISAGYGRVQQTKN